MTSPGGGNDINLAALWVPIMPETSHMREGGRKAGEELMSGFREGVGSGGTQLGQTLGSQLATGFKSGFGNLELPGGLTNVTQGLMRGFDGVSSRSENARAALERLRSSEEQLVNSHNRVAVAQSRLNDMQQRGVTSGTQYLSASSGLISAKQREESALRTTSEAHQGYTQALTSSRGGMMMFAAETGILAGAVAGAIPLIGSLIEGVIDFWKEAAEKGVEVSLEFTKHLMEIGEQYHSLGIQIQEFSTASGESLEEMESAAARVFSSLDVAGNDTGQVLATLSSRLKTTDTEALIPLTRHVEELHGRFNDLNPTDIATAFAALRVGIGDADNVLAAWLQSARTAGVDMGQLVNSLGRVGEMLRPEVTGLSAEQLGEWVARMQAVVPNISRTVTALNSAQKDFVTHNMTFREGIKEAIKELQSAATEADKEELAEKLFGTRRWAVALDMLNQYQDILGKGPDAFRANGSAIDDFTRQTQDLGNKWEEVKKKIDLALLPLATTLLSHVSGGLDTLNHYVHDHSTQISQWVKNIGDSFIRLLPTLQQWTIDILEVLKPVIQGIEAWGSSLLMEIGLVSQQMATMMDLMPGPLARLIPGFDEAKKAAHGMADSTIDMSRKMSAAIDPTGKFFDTITDKVKGLHFDVPGLTKDFDNLSDSLGSKLGAAADQGINRLPSGMKPWWGTGAAGGAPGGAPGGSLGPSAMPMAPAGNADQSSVARYIFSAAKSRGYSDEDATAIVAYGLGESSLNPGSSGGPQGAGGAPGGPQDVVLGIFQEKPGFAQSGGINPEDRGQLGPNVLAYLNQLQAHAGSGDILDQLLATSQGGPMYTGGRGAMSDLIARARRLLGMQHGGMATAYTPGSNDTPWWDQNAKRDMDPGTNISKMDPRNQYGMWWADPHGKVFHPGSSGDVGPGLWHGDMTIPSPGLPGFMPGMPFLPPWWFGGGTQNRMTYKWSGDMVSGGHGGIDDVPALLTAGEFVMNQKATSKWLNTLRWMNAQAFQGGGAVTPGSDRAPGLPQLNTQGAQVDTIAIAEAVAKVYGITDIGMYRGADQFHEHSSGEAADVMVGLNNPIGTSVKDFAMMNASQFGVQYAIWQNKMWYPDGHSSDYGSTGSNTDKHLDHVHIATAGGGFPQGGGPGADFSKGLPTGHPTSNTPAPGVATVMAGMGMGGASIPGTSFGGVAAPGGPGMAPPGSGLGAPPIGSPGTTAGYGPYGTESYDQWYQGNKAITGAQNRVTDLNTQIADKQKQLDKINQDLTTEQAKPGLLRNDQQIEAKTQQRDQLQQELDRMKSRDLPEAQGSVEEAQRKAYEDAQKMPGGQQEAKVPGVSEFTQLGGGLVKGFSQALGFGDIFGKPPWEWGIVKLMSGLANWGLGTANAWAEEIGKGHTGMTGFQPVAGMEQSGSAGLEGVLKGFGLNVPMPQPQRVDRFGRTVGPAGPVAAGPAPGMAGPAGAVGGPVIQGDYMPINVSPNVNPSAVLGPVQEQRNADNASLHTFTGGMPPP